MLSELLQNFYIALMNPFMLFYVIICITAAIYGTLDAIINTPKPNNSVLNNYEKTN